MKHLNIALIITLSLVTINLTLAHGDYSRGCMGMRHGSTNGHSISEHDMMTGFGCPMLMGSAMSADYWLSYKDDLNLSKTQILKLNEIQENYRSETAALREELSAAMSELHDLLSEDELNSSKIKTTHKRIEKIENELHTKNIDTYNATKLLLTKEQLERINEVGDYEIHHTHSCCGMTR